MRLEALDHATTKSVRHAVELITKLDPRRLCRQILRHREFKLQNLAQRCRLDRSPSNKNRSITIAPVGTRNGTTFETRPCDRASPLSDFSQNSRAFRDGSRLSDPERDPVQHSHRRQNRLISPRYMLNSLCAEYQFHGDSCGRPARDTATEWRDGEIPAFRLTT